MLRSVVLSGAKNLYDCLRDPSLRSGNHGWVHNISYLKTRAVDSATAEGRCS